jgi:uncharacterized membrane protein YfcA
MIQLVQDNLPEAFVWSHLAGMADLVLVAALLQGIGGVGFAMVSAPISLLYFPELVPGPLLVLGAAAALLGAIREFDQVDWRAVGALMTGRVGGAILAGLTLSVLPGTLFAVVFALLILVGVGFSLAGWRVVATLPNMIMAGLASGMMGTITSSGAPPLAIVMQHVPPPQMRASIACVFFFGALFSLLILAMVDRFSFAQLWLGLLLIPPVAAGFAASSPLKRLFSRAAVRMALLAISALGAIAILIRAFAAIAGG